jgi:hypothetical protein
MIFQENYLIFNFQFSIFNFQFSNFQNQKNFKSEFEFQIKIEN